MQVFFGLAEAQVVNVTFDKIVVISPPARDTTADATPIAGQVPLRVVNVNSGTQTVLAEGFRYHSAMQITAVGPTQGPFTGGTRVTIDGVDGRTLDRGLARRGDRRPGMWCGPVLPRRRVDVGKSRARHEHPQRGPDRRA